MIERNMEGGYIPWWPVLLVLVIAGIIAFLLTVDFRPDSTVEDPGNGVIAIINGEEILQEELAVMELRITTQQGVDIDSLDNQERKQLQIQAVDALVSQTLLRQASADYTATVSSEAVEERFRQIRNQFEDEDAFTEMLDSILMTEEDLREEIRSSLAINTYLEQELERSSDVEVTDIVQNLRDRAEIEIFI